MEECKYIYNLPYIERTELCRILNQNNKWEELAGVWMGYKILDIQDLRREQNPTDELLTKWGHYNHTILELFILLSKMQHYQAMGILRPFVDSKFHPLLHNGEGNLQTLLANGKLGKSIKDLQYGVHNFNVDQKQQQYKPKLFQEFTKELNQALQFGPNTETSSISCNLIASMSSIFSSCTRIPQIPYDELSAATNSWNKINILGKGGFGTVFKGIWKNTEVAIKKLDPRATNNQASFIQQMEQSFREISILNSLPHENILPLYAYSVFGEAPCLVYQCMKNGSLEERLSRANNTPPLTWLQRQEIAKGTARGLQYLHTIHAKPMIHGDIKSANILLDKNLEPKIGDFGLAKEGSSGDDSMEVTKIQGTKPYLPDEYIHKRQLSTKIDTYSYGIVLYEIASGLKVFDKNRNPKALKQYVEETNRIFELRDKSAGEENCIFFNHFIEIGIRCTSKEAADRPEMTTIYNELDKSSCSASN